MQAVIMTSAGGPEVLALQELPDPAIARDTELLVRLEAAGINPIDTKVRSHPAAHPIELPAVLGCDGAGVVEAVGGAVRDFKPGDEVYFSRCPTRGHSGTYARYCVIDERCVARKPAGLSFVEAAAAPLVLITAWESLFDRATLGAGQRVLVHAGAGGVGHVAVQLARLRGARVIATAGAERAGWVESLGAERVVPYREQDFVAATLDWSDGQGADLALDTVGGAVFERTFGALRCYGDLVTLLQPGPQVDWGAARMRNLRISLELMLAPHYLGLIDAQRHQRGILEQCAALFEAGQLSVQVAGTFPLAAAADAHRRLAAGAVAGKLVLTLS